MKRIDSQQHSDGERPVEGRLDHALRYCAIRRLELELGLERNTLIMNPFQKHALGSGENNPQGMGV